MDQTPINTDNAAAAVTRRKKFRLLPNGLSGKLLILTTLFIMLVEILIFVPSVANYRLIWLSRHFTTGEAASLALMQVDAKNGDEKLRKQLLDLTDTELIAVRFDDVSRVLATRKMPPQIDLHVLVAEPGRLEATKSIAAALDTLIFGGDRFMRVHGPLEHGSLELVMSEKPLREAMLGYAKNVMLISLLLSFMTAVLVFLALRWMLIRPLQKLTSQMLAFARNPQDANLVIKPSGRRDEIGVAEEQLSAMQKQIRGTMNQQSHLADLGLAVSKINHDLRNILASASLFSDRLIDSDDPVAKRLAPRLMRTIDRAISYTTSVLTYGKAGEALPKPAVLRLHQVFEDVAEVLALDLDDVVEWQNNVDEKLEVQADADQLFRVLLNLCRNSVQAMTADAQADGSIVKRIIANAKTDKDNIVITISDTGPGIPQEAKEQLFSAFLASRRAGGTGLGLAIAADLIRGHGGTIRLVETARPGAEFEIKLPIANGK